MRGSCDRKGGQELEQTDGCDSPSFAPGNSQRHRKSHQSNTIVVLKLTEMWNLRGKRDDVLTGRTTGMMKESNTSMQKARGVWSG